MGMVWRSLVAGILFSSGAAAVSTSELEGMIAAGDYREVLNRIETALAEGQSGLTLRLLQAEALLGIGEEAEAERLLLEMQSTFPDAPEPYNNLAALYLARGDGDEARKTLEHAMSLDRRYATIYRNLLKVNRQIARQSYVRALVVKESVTPSLARLYPSEPLRLTVAPPPPTTTVPTLVATVEMSNAIPAVDTGGPAGRSDEVKEVAPVASRETGEIAVEPVVVATVEDPPVVEPTPAPVAETPTVPIEGDETDLAIKAALAAWAEAWRGKAAIRYLASYADAFRPRSGLSHADWRSQRQQRIERPRWIEVELREVTLKRRDDGTIDVHFIQRYATNRYGDLTRKRLRFRLIDGQWRIIDEVTLEMLS